MMGATGGQYLTFRIAEEDYAVGILRVREIIQYEATTRVPKTAPWIRGVINLRGRVVPVVDLAVKFGLGQRVVTPATCIVILDVDLAGETALMGILTDAVNEVVDLAQADIEPPPSFGTSVDVDYLVGMGKAPGGFTLILDIDRVLSADELVAASRAAASGGEAEPSPVGEAEASSVSAQEVASP